MITDEYGERWLTPDEVEDLEFKYIYNSLSVHTDDHCVSTFTINKSITGGE